MLKCSGRISLIIGIMVLFVSFRTANLPSKLLVDTNLLELERSWSFRSKWFQVPKSQISWVKKSYDFLQTLAANRQGTLVCYVEISGNEKADRQRKLQCSFLMVSEPCALVLRKSLQQVIPKWKETCFPNYWQSQNQARQSRSFIQMKWITSRLTKIFTLWT